MPTIRHGQRPLLSNPSLIHYNPGLGLVNYCLTNTNVWGVITLFTTQYNFSFMAVVQAFAMSYTYKTWIHRHSRNPLARVVNQNYTRRYLTLPGSIKFYSRNASKRVPKVLGGRLFTHPYVVRG